ncbi:MAG: glycoside hydrolase family 1 protein [Candidatus Dormibacteraceae bacterium]
MTPRSFPRGFLWGTAAAAHQVEGGNHGNDWWEWEQQGGILTGDSSDPACDHYHRFRQDIQLLRQMHTNAHRLSLEWSRIEPLEGQFDGGELAHYREVLTELREQGVTPMVTLHHFTSPTWFTRRGGWAASGAPAAFSNFVRRVAMVVGDLPGFWVTLNEPNIYALQGWILGEFPPGRRGDLRGAHRVLANMYRAHLLAYQDLRRLTPRVPVGIAHHKLLFLPAQPRLRDRAAAGLAQALMDRWPTTRGRLQKVVAAPADFLGLNHYTAQMVALDALHPEHQFMRRSNPPERPTTDFGWAVDANWMRRCLLELIPRGLPVYITENGIATSDDDMRQRFLLDVLDQVWEAIEAHADVRGYFHWSSMDNFEWARGYSMRFGLVAVDRQTQERTLKPSGHLYGQICRDNQLPLDGL